MLQRTLLFLSAVTLALALGNGRSQYYGQQTFNQQQISQGHISAGFGSPQAGHAAPSPYSFAYEAQADGGHSSRQESADSTGKVAGSYSLIHEDGSKRHVKYEADSQGFRAVIDTDELGTKSDNPARVTINSAAPTLEAKKITSYQGKAYNGKASQPIQYNFGAGSENGEPSPYSFAYTSQLEDGSSSHSEASDGSGKVSGSYSLSQKDGRKRTVDYSADAAGFKASVKSNELGTKSENPAHVSFLSTAQQGTAEHSSAAGQYYSSWEQQAQVQKQASQFQSSGISSSISEKPSPYSFSYDNKWENGGNARTESSDGSGKVKGSYSLFNSDGRHRTVDYSAGTEGFIASVQTNEHGTKSDSPADVKFLSSAVLDAPHSPQATSYASSFAAKQASTYSAPSQGQYQPTQYNIGSAPEGKPFPYSFNYDGQWDDGSSSRSESSDGSGKVTGSYSLSHKDGRRRNVEYSADAGGFRASVQTNEFGTKSDSPADVRIISTAPADASSGPSFSSGAPGAPMMPSAPYSSAGHSSYQPVQYSIGTAEEGKPFPYSFNYDNKWDDGGNARRESSDGSGKVTGSYSLFNTDGRRRTVDYSADTAGFRASVQTNEFGTKGDSPADVQFYSSAPASEPQEPSVYSSFSNGQKASSYGQSTQIQQQFQPIQFSMGSAPEGKPFPYSFSYQSQLDDGSNSHKEASDGSGKVTGSYSLSNKDGRQRTVDYSADIGGFKASVQTNEFGTKSDSPADVKFYSSAASDFSAASKGSHTYSGSAPSQGASTGQFYGSSTAFQSSQRLEEVESGSASGQAASTGQFYGSLTAFQSSQNQISPVSNGAPSPYQFDYSAEATGGASSRNEAADSSGKVTGAYSVTNEDGSSRLVEYIADQQGFRAKVKTNEPGTKSDNPADVTFESAAPDSHPASRSASPSSYSASAPKFPARTYTPKSSMTGQVRQAKIW